MQIAELMETHRWCYFLDITELFRVNIVFENVNGHFPSGSGDTSPWYWDEAVCAAQNEKRGLSKGDVSGIVASSMFGREK